MANKGQNKGRVLRPALRRFAKNLIDEARDVLGIDSNSKLDEALQLEDGTSQRYALYPLDRRNTRAPQAAGIQSLENRVAKLLRRPAHKVVIHNIAPLREEAVDFYTTLDLDIGEPRAEANLRDYAPGDLELGYEDDWPTYSRLGKFDLSHAHDQTRLVNMYAWQWGILWDRGILPDHWSRPALGIPPGTPVEEFLPAIVQHLARLRQAYTTLSLARKFVGPFDFQDLVDVMTDFQRFASEDGGCSG